MEKWGFGLSRLEVLDVVRDFVISNGLETPFKNGTPGEDWFLAFKKRHSLSIKKPQSVEYARKKMTDPFVVQNYFTLLRNTLDELELNDKPEQIWNLDETSFCLDPSKTKVVGKKGSPSSRTISGPGKENTTVLSGCSAAGNKAPPLIVFKGKNIWDQWMAPQGKGFPNTAYAASPNGWMETEIFANFFEKTFLPCLGSKRPILLVYDGHSTHVGSKVIEIAMREAITILKLPPHTSHLLQPLDLSVFKSMKTTWDQKLVQWQRRHVGQKLPKSTFSELLGETWTSISRETLSNGFRKAGIHPYNNAVIPEDRFDPSAMERWKRVQETQVGLLVHPVPTAEDVARQDLSGSGSFERLLLGTVKQSSLPIKRKKSRVAPGAEIITTEEVLARLEETPRQTPCRSKKARVEPAVKIPAQGAPSEASDDEDDVEPLDVVTEEDSDLAEGKWVLVKYSSNRRVLYYVGLIISKNHSIHDSDWNVKFVKFKDGHFFWPEIEDHDTISSEDVVKVLPVPIIDRRGDSMTFSVKLDGYKMS